MTASTRRELRSAATSTSTTAIGLIRALTDARPIKPTSTRCLSARRPNPRQRLHLSTRKFCSDNRSHLIFHLSRHPVFADEPSLVAGQMLLALVPDPLWWSVGDPHPDRGETSLELSFRAGAPTDGAPFGVGQHILGRYR